MGGTIKAEPKEIVEAGGKKGLNYQTEEKRTIPLKLRFAVLSRDKFRCCICGKSPAIDVGTILHIDHIVPFSKGGKTTLSNLQTLCSECNLGKSDLEIIV
jgi:5-methylcytosine-specific restriction endonuclease McrA